MTDASQAGAMPPSAAHELSRSLKPRHVSMITFGGIIGAGLFAGSSTAISSIGPAAVPCYALAGFPFLPALRMLSGMPMAPTRV